MIRNGHTLYVSVVAKNLPNGETPAEGFTYHLIGEIDANGPKFYLRSHSGMFDDNAHVVELTLEQALNVEAYVFASHELNNNLNEMVAEVVNATWVFDTYISISWEAPVGSRLYRSYDDAMAYAKELAADKATWSGDDVLIQPERLR